MIKNLSRYVAPERISENVELKDYTTFKVGGPADIMVTVETVSELTGLIAYLNKCMANYMVIGNGSNLLVSDEGYKGIVIRLSGEFQEISTDSDKIVAGAGASLANVCKAAMNESLSGL